MSEAPDHSSSQVPEDDERDLQGRQQSEHSTHTDPDTLPRQCPGHPQPHQRHCLCSYQVSNLFFYKFRNPPEWENRGEKEENMGDMKPKSLEKMFVHLLKDAEQYCDV